MILGNTMIDQILSGVEPMEAIKYQMLVMFLIGGGTGLGVVAAVHAGASTTWRRIRSQESAGGMHPDDQKIGQMGFRSGFDR